MVVWWWCSGGERPGGCLLTSAGCGVKSGVLAISDVVQACHSAATRDVTSPPASTHSCATHRGHTNIIHNTNDLT